MSKTVTGAVLGTVTLVAGDNPVLITSSGSIYGATVGIYGGVGTAWSITNQGTILGTEPDDLVRGSGIELRDGGSIDNSGVISGYDYAIFIDGAEATVTNSGTIGTDGTYTAAFGIGLLAGGTVTNVGPDATITGAYAGVNFYIGAGTVINAGTISGGMGISVGVALKDGGYVENQATDGTLGLISGYLGGVIAAGAATTVVNQGSIVSTIGYGVWLMGGGSVTNGASGAVASAAAIYGGKYGVYVGDGPGTVINYGTIASGMCGCGTYDGILLREGGTVTNAENATITGYRTGIYAILEAATVTNSGSISGVFGEGIRLLSGGTISNSSSGSIYGLARGINAVGLTTVTNDGLIASGLCGCDTYDGILLQDAGSVTNTASGTITGYTNGVYIAGGTGTVINAGSIGGMVEAGVRLGDGGTVINGSTMAGGGDAAITGTSFGVQISGEAGTVINHGTIANTASAGSVYAFDAVYLGSGGSVTNAAGGTITGYLNGVYISTEAGTVTNLGVIASPLSGSGVRLSAGGTVVNGSTLAGGEAASIIGEGFGINIDGDVGTVVNHGSVASGQDPGSFAGVALGAGGSVTNSASGRITGYLSGVYVSGGAGTVTNAGTIEAPDGGDGVAFLQGGTIVNGSTAAGGTAALITGFSFGVRISGDAGTVTNFGTIASGDDPAAFDGVYLAAGGSVSNASSGTISGYENGIAAWNTAATVTNDGLVIGTSGAGIAFYEGGTITNAAGAVISGATGVRMDDTGGAGSTLVNAGTITATGPSDFAVFFDAPGDRLVIHPGAVFNGLVVGGGTDATIELASAASAGTLSGLGTDFLYFDHVDVDAGATWTLAGTNSVGLGITFTIAAGASLDVTGTLTGGAAFVLDAAILRLANGVDGGDSFDFTDVGEVGPDTLTLDAVTGTSFDNPIFGFSYLDKIVLPGVTFVAGSTAVLDVNTLTIQLQGGGEFTFGNFLLAAGAPTSFIIGEHSVQDALCFLAGTWIATPDGERLVQHLAIGDAVRLADGGVERVLWIGTGRVLVTPGRRSAATPVVVRRGALADNVPHRDLRVTKGHSLLVDGVLIPVEFLVNHRSIMWDDRAREVAIYHVELTRHGVLLADGAPAESYRDDGNRWLFQNGNAGWVLPPQPPCAPVLTGGALVDAAWQRLLLRAGRRPGLPITQDPDLHLLADGVRVDARDRSGTVHRFRLAAPPRDLRIVSRAAIPGELGLARDSRPLGVALWRVVTAQQRVIEADDHTLADGYHAFEHGNGWRWTNGEAALPAALFAGLSGPVEVELHVGCTASYLLEGEEQQPAALRLAA